MDPSNMKLITDAGTVGVCIFVIWMGWKREERAAKTFDSLNQNSQTIHNETIKQLTMLNESTRTLHEEIRNRPCVSEANCENFKRHN